MRLLFALAALVVVFGAGGCASSSSAPRGGETATIPRARPHHYLFAHRVVPQFFFKNTDEFFLGLQSDPSAEMIRVWDHVGQGMKPADLLPSDGLEAEYRADEDGVRMIFVTLPAAKIPPEALYAVLAIRGRDRWYFTYEQSAPLLGIKPVAILCGWDSAGRHINYGIAGDYSRAAFEKILAEFLKNPGREPAAVTEVPGS